jgi:hypothetical protein
MTPGGPRFEPANTDHLPPRVARLETWAGRHDEWSHHRARELGESIEEHCTRLTSLEAKMQRVLATIGGMKLRWAIVAWVVGTALSAVAAWLAAR